MLEDRQSFRILNSIRNKFAHSLGYKLTEVDGATLQASLSPRMAEVFATSTTAQPIRTETVRGRVATRIASMLIRLTVIERAATGDDTATAT